MFKLAIDAGRAALRFLNHMKRDGGRQEINALRLFEKDRLSFPISGRRDSVIILGLGNILLSDEGVGVHAVAALKERYTFYPSIDIVDGGTMGLDLLPLFQERDRILIIDAVDFRKHPGHIERLEGDAIASLFTTKLSVHHIGLADLLFATKLIRETPMEICLLGIQPQSLETGLEMSDNIKNKVNRILIMAVQKLDEWNIKSSGVRENITHDVESVMPQFVEQVVEEL